MNRIITRYLLVSAAVLTGLLLWYRSAQMGLKPQKQTAARPVVCLDPGHPSESNSGRKLQNGVSELDINWEVAQKLEKILKMEGAVDVIKTRRLRDSYVRNSARAEFANEHHAAIVLHLHCDAGPSRGFTVYYPDRKGHAENRVGPEPQVIESSKLAAYAMHREMAKQLNGILHDRGIKGDSSTLVGSANGALTTSIFSKAPTITVEMVFLSNPGDARFIRDDAGQETMAQALARGVTAFLQNQSKQ